MKVQVVFQNLEKSTFIRNMVEEKVGAILSKFPQSDAGEATVYVKMDNSRHQAGPDLFHVKVVWRERRGAPIILTRKSQNVFEAAAAVSDRLLERINRVHHRSISRNRNTLRQLKRSAAYQPSPAA